ncbi:thiamine pyrophosphate-dependent enzyme [Chloroflexota bacterium]
MITEAEATKTIAQHRGDCVVLLGGAQYPEWPEGESDQPELRFFASLGKCTSYGLGLALARPDRRIIAFSGDGGLLSNLGSLVTIANMAPPNLVLFVFANDVWETTGGQPLPCAEGRMSLIGFARAAGFPKVYEFDQIDEFREHIENILNEAGPTFVCLKTARGGKRFPSARKLHEDVRDFKAALEKSLPQAK